MKGNETFICIALVLATGGCADVTGPLARTVTAATTPAVLSENFESPKTTNYTVYRAGQTLTTSTNTWVVESGSIDVFNAQVRREAVPFDGIQAVDLAGSPGAGVMSTSFATAPGQRYNIRFYYARNNGLGSNAGRANVAVLGASPLLQAELLHQAPRQFNQNVAFSGTFVADGAKATLRFTSLTGGSYGITIDGITIRPMSAPQ